MDEIAVIVPVYNTKKYLKQCLISLANQTINVPYRVYIIDDGSNDDSAEIANMYVNEYPLIFSYLHKENGGLSSARNKGLDESSSEYVTFVDSDDYVDENYLLRLYSLCVDKGAQVSMCGVNRVIENDGKGNRFDTGFSTDFVSCDIDSVLMKSSFAAWNKMFCRSLINEIRFPFGKTYEDFATIPLIMNRAKVIAYTHEVLYHYRVNPDSIIQTAKKNRKSNRDIIYAQHLLENSELKGRTSVLESMYIRRVLSSLVWTILEYNENKTDVYSIINEGIQKYPHIRTNPCIRELPWHKRVFVRLILKKRIRLARIWISGFGISWKMYAYLRHFIK